MDTQPQKKQCAILLAMGGPGNLDQIGQFLYNIFSDRSIIRLPGGKLFQKPLARMISTIRKKKVQRHYEQIGGSSPLLKWTIAQARHVEDIIRRQQPDFRCYVGMRYSDPSIEEAIRQAYDDGFRVMHFVPMYPQYSKATTGSSFGVARDVLASLPDVESHFVKDFHDSSSYATILKDYIDKNIAEGDTLLFSAHSLPQRFVDEGDPYVDQVKATAKLAAADREYHVSFQSRTGPVDWVGPDTVEEAKRLLDEKPGNLFVVPISFICDHIETLYEIDVELAELLGTANSGRLRRMPMFNDDPAFADAISGMIVNKELSNVEN